MAHTLSKSILVKTDPETAFEAWTDPERMPGYMPGVRSVERLEQDRLRWSMVSPDGAELEWITEATRSEPPTRFAWSTVEGDVSSSGQVTFSQLEDGQTEVTMMVNFGSEATDPAGMMGLLEPEEQVTRTLRAFKAMLEGR